RCHGGLRLARGLRLGGAGLRRRRGARLGRPGGLTLPPLDLLGRAVDRHLAGAEPVGNVGRLLLDRLGGLHRAARDARRRGGAVAAVEAPGLVQYDRLEQAVLADVVQELAELGTLDLQQREEVGGRVVVEGGRRGGVRFGCAGHTTYSRLGGGCYVGVASSAGV